MSILESKRSEVGNLIELIQQTTTYAERTLSTLSPFIELKERLATLQKLVQKCYDSGKNKRLEFVQLSSSIKDICNAIQTTGKKYRDAKFPR